MSSTCVRKERTRRFAPAVLLAAGIFAFAPISKGQATIGPVTIGAGLRTSYENTNPDGADSTDHFLVNSARIYINGQVMDHIKFTFNTEYDGNPGTNKVELLDAIARLEYSKTFNIWAGRFLPPSDRANLTGPYYSSHWGVYNDGIENGHTAVFQGRDNGVVYWGDFGKHLKVSAGAFDGAGTGKTDVLGAFRVQINLLDPEDGYYVNGTYYGGKKVLSIAGALQVQDGATASTIDLLFETKASPMGVVTFESEYASYNRLGGYAGPVGGYAKDRGFFVLGAYMFPKAMGPGKVQLLVKYAKADYSAGVVPSANLKSTEFDFNYIMKEFNARFMGFVRHEDYSKFAPDYWKAGIGLQIQM